jgi:hypothetical protein
VDGLFYESAIFPLMTQLAGDLFDDLTPHAEEGVFWSRLSGRAPDVSNGVAGVSAIRAALLCCREAMV